MLGIVGRCVVVAIIISLEHNPFSSRGRTRIKHTIRRSGPAYQLPEFLSETRCGRDNLAGWRMGAFLNMLVLALCLLIETAILIIALLTDKMVNPHATVPGVPDSAFNGLLYHGRCKMTKR